MPTHLVIIPPSPGEAIRPAGVVCPRCSEHFGFTFRPHVTIRPQAALRLPSGTIVIENPVVICATCAHRGVDTVL